MRLCTFRDSAGTRLGRVDGDTVRPLAGTDVSAALAAIANGADPPVPRIDPQPTPQSASGQSPAKEGA